MRYFMAAVVVAIVIGAVFYFRKWVNDMSDGDPPSGAT